MDFETFEQAEAWDAWVAANDKIALDRKWDLGGVGTLRVAGIENVRGFLLQGSESVLDRLKGISAEDPAGEAEPSPQGEATAAAAEEAELEVATASQTSLLSIPFAKQHPLRFGDGTGLRLDALAGTAGTGALLGGILLGIVAAVVAVKLSVAFGIFLFVLAGLIAAVGAISLRGAELESAAVDGKLRLKVDTVVVADLESGKAKVTFKNPAAIAPLPKIYVSGKFGGVAIKDAAVDFKDPSALDAILRAVPLPELEVDFAGDFGAEGAQGAQGAQVAGAARRALTAAARSAAARRR